MTKIPLTYAVIILLGLFLPSGSAAVEYKDKKVDKIRINEDSAPRLNGDRLKDSSIFKVSLSHSAPYLSEKANDLASILSDDGAKKLEVEFYRDIDARRMVDAWRKGFEDLARNSPETTKSIEKIISLTPNLQAGEVFIFSFIGQKVIVTFPGVERFTLENEKFAKALLAIWLSGNPRGEKLIQSLKGE